MNYEDEEDVEGAENEENTRLAEEEASASSVEELENAAKREPDLIGEAEATIFILIAVSADLFELIAAFAAIVPIVGWVTWGMALFFGIIASSIIFLWTSLRSVKGSFVTGLVLRKALIFFFGALIDSLTGGALPLRTAVLLLVIWMHNREAKNGNDRFVAIIRKAIVIASKI
ncbi:MAG: hypothetical protein Q8P97_00685 [bacterium]|nr:hypothetical protein [bacterium]